MERRSFFGRVVTGLALGGSARGADVRPGDVPMRVFGKTGVKLSLIGQAGGRFPLCTFEEACAITQRSYDLGLNYFDNAHTYWDGKSEEVFGAVLPKVRKNVFITTKTLDRTKAGALAQLEQSLKRMKTDYVDLWQIHSLQEMEDVDKVAGPGGAVEALEQAKKQGKCRFIGFTGHRDPHVHAEMLKRYKGFDTILMPLHLADPGYLSFEKIVLPEAIRQGLGIQAMKTTANAKLLQSFNIRQCLTYALSLPGVHVAPVGCTTIGQIEDDVRIVKSLQKYSEAEMSTLRASAQKLAGPQLEDWKRNTQTASLHTYVGG
jgi:uncharacterized protein